MKHKKDCRCSECVMTAYLYAYRKSGKALVERGVIKRWRREYRKAMRLLRWDIVIEELPETPPNYRRHELNRQIRKLVERRKG